MFENDADELRGDFMHFFLIFFSLILVEDPNFDEHNFVSNGWPASPSWTQENLDVSSN